MKALDGLWRKSGHPGRLNPFFLNQVVQGRYRDVTQEGQLFGLFAGIAILDRLLPGLFGPWPPSPPSGAPRRSACARRWVRAVLDVLKLFLWQFTAPVLLANLIAWPLSFFLMTKWLQGFAYRIDLTVWPFVLATVAAVLIALVDGERPGVEGGRRLVR